MICLVRRNDATSRLLRTACIGAVGVAVLFSEDRAEAALQDAHSRSGVAIPWQTVRVSAGAARMDIVERIGEQLAKRDRRTALKIAAELRGTSEEAWFLTGVTKQWSASDAPAASKFVAQLVEGPLKRDLARLVVERWAAARPSDTAAWVSGLPEGSTRNAALSVLLEKWVDSDVEAARRWAAELPAPAADQSQSSPALLGMAGEMRLTNVRFNRWDALQLVAFHWARRDPAAVRKWAASITEGGLRKRIADLLTIMDRR